ncbi:MAG: hypothetical protein E6K82_09155 [Candidatus Rokuibacteriota bacterium]|nr:MAG: hypothetical protein E6K82_09155 [Candidatus Rokubacteria bacterium]
MLNFFRSEDHARNWRRTQPDEPGVATPLAQAFVLGKRLFGDVLSPRAPGQ